MSYLIILFIIFLMKYTFSYGKYEWNKGNRGTAIGTFMLAVISIILPAFQLITR